MRPVQWLAQALGQLPPTQPAPSRRRWIRERRRPVDHDPDVETDPDLVGVLLTPLLVGVAWIGGSTEGCIRCCICNARRGTE
jgi:hypothetical protein